MAKLFFLHLSDIHLRSNSDPVLKRIPEMAAAVQNIDRQIDAAVVAVSGDLVNKGNISLFPTAWNFLSELASALQATLGSSSPGVQVPVSLIAIPGNHDCDFSGDQTVRDILLSKVASEPSQAVSPSVLSHCTGVQDKFFEALETTGVGAGTIHLNQRLAYEYSIPVADETVRILCFNSAWMSKRVDNQGSLHIPASVVPNRTAEDQVVISMFHHPYRWHQAVAAREFQKKIELISDLILTGHEHDASRKLQTASTGEVNEYIEGAALQGETDPIESRFNVFILDVSNRKQKAAEFRWEIDRYVPLNLGSLGTEVFNPEWEELHVARLRGRGIFRISQNMEKVLDDPGATLVHRNKGVLSLPDVFVFPDLEEIFNIPGTSSRRVSGNEAPQFFMDEGNLIVLGDSLSGKTCLAKSLYRYFHQKQLIPLLISGTSRVPTDDKIQGWLCKQFAEQYDTGDPESYRQLDRTKRVVILDDYHLLPASSDYRNSLLASLKAFAGRVVLLADELVAEAHTLFGTLSLSDSTNPVTFVRIRQFGHLRRDSLIEKWLRLSDLSDVSQAEFAMTRDRIANHLTTLTGQNLLPAYPVYVLAILQGMEALTPWDTNISSYGSYYELLIRAALARGRSPVHSEIILNYLAHLAFRMFDSGQLELSLVEFRSCHRDYESRYHIELAANAIREDMMRCHIFKRSDDEVTFKYPYVYYYFVARWLREQQSQAATRDVIERLSRSLHIDDSANILLFLAHLSKEPLVEVMQNAARSFYPDVVPADLVQMIEFDVLSRKRGAGPVLVEQDSNEMRRVVLQTRDQQRDAETMLQFPQEEPETAATILEPMVSLNAATKTLQILGQLLKNFPGSLDGSTKLGVARDCYLLGLRILSTLFNALRETDETILEEVAKNIRSANPKITQNEAEIRALSFLVTTTELLGLVVIRLISSAIGSPELEQTYQRIEREIDTPAVRLVNVSVHLDHSVAFPDREVRTLAKNWKDDTIVRRLLQYLVLIRLHLIPMETSTKQSICAALGIKYDPSIDPGAKSPVLRLPERC